MNRVQFVIHSIFLLLCAVLAPKTFAEPQNLALLMQEVVQYHDSGAYTKEIEQKINEAINYITIRAKTNQKNPNKEKLAIILDIDETSLSNYKYMFRRHFHATREQLHHEIAQADAATIVPTLKLYKQAKKLGIDVFFVTGRIKAQSDYTIKNLIRAGYNDWNGIFFKPNNYKEYSVIPFKSKIREQLSNQGYRIIASIGDQCSDIEGGFLEKGFKLPNPYYFLP